MILMIDNYDSFVYNLVQYIEELGEAVVVKRNNEIKISDIEELNPEVIVLSPGPCSPKEAGICIDIVEHFKGKKPILGICLGHQTIGYVFGGDIIKAQQPVHGKVYSINHTNKGVFRGLKNPLNVTRYHSLIIDSNTVPKELEITAITDKGEIMGIRHKKYLIEGVQFHPEAILSEYGHEMLENFITEARERVHM
ncbi:para-aminobenzoate/anthranilate synthase glutamine amidotransferase component II [Clostridioides difficile]|uniref:Para-aminobenzoate synthase glutamine amidotransferase component II n=3 Tax=Clostridioides difficile TaxID=1496 RepID=A0A9R0BJS7_CLODR|nr:aminodeoxychorismate/anthranilate synthase component II [Clostridioides difficile]OFU04793.1 anthranilate synthase component II [Clostridium sp. HMSC19E03]OFU16216.1 anthranilate synthase component II [Clostridium sp. HMSC19C09]OFU18083.1 anthranilate synthase component II [Clostridium sp. HMSC19C05]OFU19788.1 anthranilate synthase component II [Clostridium sp. HMSC19C08]OFU33284.1 anthranilate synthase component II [Clostridium sp. HMSC19B10]OFU39038.1 anthranilate synthase component II [